MANIIFRKVEDGDFNQIAPLYHSYIDWHISLDPNKYPGHIGKKLSPDELVDIFHGRKKGADAYEVTQSIGSSNFYGWVAENSDTKQILAFYLFKGNLEIDPVATARISVLVDNNESEVVAENLLVYCFSELKKLGYIAVEANMSKRMRVHSRLGFLKKYAQIITDPDDEGKVKYWRQL